MERRVARRSRGPPALKNVENIIEGEAWEGARAWSYHFSGLAICGGVCLVLSVQGPEAVDLCSQ